jgi:hypothetical protein
MVFALQKLALVSGVGDMQEKMPIVATLGEQFEWANMMFASPWSKAGNGSATTNCSTAGNSTEGNSTTSRMSSCTTIKKAVTSSARFRHRRRLSRRGQSSGLTSAYASEDGQDGEDGGHSSGFEGGCVGAISALLRIGRKRFVRWADAIVEHAHHHSAYETVLSVVSIDSRMSQDRRRRLAIRVSGADVTEEEQLSSIRGKKAAIDRLHYY